MIEIRELTKTFEGIRAVDNITTTIHEGQIFGLVGSNGAGKSTFLRLLSGIMKADQGTILIDGQKVFENLEIKNEICFLPDTAYFFPNATVRVMKNYYKMVYKKFDEKKFDELAEKFHVEMDRKISTFSKGMKKQVSVICGICAGTDYLFCDETFDGLDPVMRQTVKSIFAADMEDRNLTPIIASHNLRELEDICDHVGLLHKGGILLSKDLDDMKLNIHKVQCVLQPGMKPEDLVALDKVGIEQRGRLCTVTVRGSRQEVEAILSSYDPVFYECIPLSLEEIFISETEVAGYDIRKLIL